MSIDLSVVLSVARSRHMQMDSLSHYRSPEMLLRCGDLDVLTAQADNLVDTFRMRASQ